MNSPADPRRPGTSPGQSSSLPGSAPAPGPGTWGLAVTEPWYLGPLWDLQGDVYAVREAVQDASS